MRRPFRWSASQIEANVEPRRRLRVERAPDGTASQYVGACANVITLSASGAGLPDELLADATVVAGSIRGPSLGHRRDRDFRDLEASHPQGGGIPSRPISCHA